MTSHALLLALLVPGALQAPEEPVWQDAPPSATTVSDSTALHRQAREAQARFSRAQVREAPRTQIWSGGECDERIGWICLRFQAPRGDPDPWRMDRRPPPENEALREARLALLEELGHISRQIPGDRWVRGQWVRYLGEADRWKEAHDAARQCIGEAPGWCEALQALTLHRLGLHTEAEEAFSVALHAMGEEEAEAWLDPSGLVDFDLLRELDRHHGEERGRFVERFWTLADPWYGTESNELLLEHLSRNVIARIQEGARSPHGPMWGADLREYIIRFGPEVSYARRHDPSILGAGTLVSGYPEPDLRVLVPGPALFRDPGENGEGFRVPASEFTTERAVGRGLHRVAPTLRVRDLPSRVTRFPRGDSTLVVLAWSYPVPAADHDYWQGVDADTLPPPWPVDATPELWWRSLDPTSGAVGESRPARPMEEGEEIGPGDGERRAGWYVGMVPSGAGVLSLELREPAHQRGWRFRQGIELPTPAEGEPILSDLLLLRPDPERHETGVSTLRDEGVRELAMRALSENQIEGRSLEVAWQATGFGFRGAPLEVRAELEPADRGWLRRAGERLRILSPGSSVRMGWTDQVDGPLEDPESGLRVLGLELDGLDAGVYRIRLTLVAGDGTERSREIEVELI
jgi:hypothetical protein